MKRIVIILTVFFNFNSAFSQIGKNVYELNSMENLLTDNVKEIVDTNLKDIKVVFLGESNHYIGSDLLAKTEFVKYLVLKEGYKDIAFESDFFALYYEHKKENLFPMWSNSTQCRELFKFLKEHNVTIWGFDPQMFFPYTSKNFANNLSKLLSDNGILVDENFIPLTEKLFTQNNIEELIGKSDLANLSSEIDTLLINAKVIHNMLLFQLLENYKSYIALKTSNKDIETGTPIRDSQMAKNLNFLVKSMPDKKFIVWLANDHMIKDDYGTRQGQTMGFQFEKLNPNIAYHIAFSSINMPYRKPRLIKKYSEDKENLLNFLPSTDKNYFIDAKKIIAEDSQFRTNEYYGMFSSGDKPINTNWFNHFDALVFISKGENNIIK